MKLKFLEFIPIIVAATVGTALLVTLLLVDEVLSNDQDDEINFDD